jgi:hypothetical protein
MVAHWERTDRTATVRLVFLGDRAIEIKKPTPDRDGLFNGRMAVTYFSSDITCLRVSLHRNTPLPEELIRDAVGIEAMERAVARRVFVPKAGHGSNAQIKKPTPDGMGFSMGAWR